jgi:hypothetical protein
MQASESTMERFADAIKSKTFAEAAASLSAFDKVSIKLIQAFYRIRAKQIAPILQDHGFRLLRITSRGTEIYPTMCDFEKRAIDRYRIDIHPQGPLATKGFDQACVQSAMLAVQTRLVALGWILSETMLNRSFIDGEGERQGKEVAGVSKPYAMNLGINYSDVNLPI